MSWDSITNALVSLEAAVNLAKGLTAVDKALDQTEQKLKIIELRETLAEAREAILESKEVTRSLHEEIEELQEALRNKARIVRRFDAYYEMDDTGAPSGDPYCLRCWETRHELVHLVRSSKHGNPHQCPSCRHEYSKRHAPFSNEQRAQ